MDWTIHNELNTPTVYERTNKFYFNKDGSGTLNIFKNGRHRGTYYPNAVSVYSDTEFKMSGSHSARFEFFGPDSARNYNSESNAHSGGFYTGDDSLFVKEGDEMWVKSWMYLSPGWSWGPGEGGGSGVKILRVYPMANAGNFYLGGNGAFRIENIPNHPSRTYYPKGNMIFPVGKWFSIEYYMKFMSNSNGSVKVWVDDELIHDISSITFNSKNVPNEWGWIGPSVHFFPIWDAWPSKHQKAWVDNITITTDSLQTKIDNNFNMRLINKMSSAPLILNESIDHSDQTEGMDFVKDKMLLVDDLSTGFNNTWYDGSKTNGYKFITDDLLNRKVLHVDWINKSKGPASARHLFEASDDIYFEYKIRFSPNWDFSAPNHIIHLLSDRDGKWSAPAMAYGNINVDVGDKGKVVLRWQDSKMVNTKDYPDALFSTVKYPRGNNLLGIEEERSSGGCNVDYKDPDLVDDSCYKWGSDWRSELFIYGNQDDFKVNSWHDVAVRVRLNSIVDSVAQADGIFDLSINGNVVVSKHNMIFRSGTNKNINMNQFLIGPYLHKGGDDVWLRISDLKVYSVKSEDGVVKPTAIEPTTNVDDTLQEKINVIIKALEELKMNI